MKIKIAQGRVICKAQSIDKVMDVYIEGDKIIALDHLDDFHEDIFINAHQHIVSPGFIDLYSSLGELDFDFKEIKTAGSAGFTTVTLQPHLSFAIDKPATAEFVKRGHFLIDLIPTAFMTQQNAPERLTDYGKLKVDGCPFVSAGAYPMINTHVLRLCLEYARNYDLTVMCTPQDAYLGEMGLIHEGEMSLRLGLPGIPSCAEAIEMYRYISLSALTDAKVHFNKISTREGVELVRYAKSQGLRVTASVAMHQLWFNHMDLQNFNTDFHFSPPLREESDQKALLNGLRDGTIDVIVSDHVGCSFADKNLPFSEAKKGLSSYQTFLGFALRLEQYDFSIMDILGKFTSNAAQLLDPVSYEGGQIAVSKLANLCIFDPKSVWKIEKNDNFYSPFVDWEFSGGQVSKTIVRGKIFE